MPASISSNTIVSPPATAAIASATRESSPPEAVSATGPNGSPAFGRIRNTTSSAPVAPGSRSREHDAETRRRRGRLPAARPATAAANGSAAVARACRSSACSRPTLRLRPRRAPRPRLDRVVPVVGQRPSSRRAASPRSSSSANVCARWRRFRSEQVLELGLDLLEPPGLRLERGEERAQVRCGLAQLQLGLAQRVPAAAELRREPLERCDGALGAASQVGRALALLRRQRRRSVRDAPRRARSTCTQPLALGAELVLAACSRSPSVASPSRRSSSSRAAAPCRVARQLVVGAACRSQLAPRAPPRRACPHRRTRRARSRW